jgi:hypothetical protein
MRSFALEKEFRAGYAYSRIYKRLEAKDTSIPHTGLTDH